MFINFIQWGFINVCFPVEYRKVVIVEDVCIFIVVCCKMSSFIFEVLGVVGSMMPLESFDEFEDYVPSAFWVCFEIFSLAFFC